MTTYECKRCGETHQGLAIDDYSKLGLLEALTYDGPFPHHAGDVFTLPSPTYTENHEQ